MVIDNHNETPPTSEHWQKTFDKCPGCGSTERFWEGILKELRSRGLLPQEVGCFDFQLTEGIGLPQQKLQSLSYGTEIPGFQVARDICCSCGLEYTTYLERRVVKKSIALARPGDQFLNRAQRRRIGREN